MTVWNTADRRSISTLTGHQNRVNRVSYSSDGRRLVTTSGDRTVMVWDPADGRQLAVLAGHTDDTSDAQFLDNDRRLVTVAQDGTARIWDVSRLVAAPNRADACGLFVGPAERRFTQDEINADPLLKLDWTIERDICAGLLGAPPPAIPSAN